jgi:hypothetical protein
MAAMTRQILHAQRHETPSPFSPKHHSADNLVNECHLASADNRASADDRTSADNLEIQHHLASADNRASADDRTSADNLEIQHHLASADNRASADDRTSADNLEIQHHLASADDLASRHKQTANQATKPTNPKRLCPREAVKFNGQNHPAAARPLGFQSRRCPPLGWIFLLSFFCGLFD